MSRKGYLNHEVRALGVQAPAVLAPEPLRRLLHLNPRLCNQASNQAENTKKNHIKQATVFNLRRQNHKQLNRAPLDSPVTQMTRPAKGPSACAAGPEPAAGAARDAAEEETDAADEGL